MARRIGTYLGKRNQYFFKLKIIYYTSYWSSCVGSVGSNVKFLGRVFITNPKNLEIGNDCTINEGVIIVTREKVKIGNRVRISPQVMIISGALEYEVKPEEHKVHTAMPIAIADDVWIASGAKILQGVTIGENSVIASGAVVTKDVPSNSIVRGVPGKVYRKDA